MCGIDFLFTKPSETELLAPQSKGPCCPVSNLLVELLSGDDPVLEVGQLLCGADTGQHPLGKFSRIPPPPSPEGPFPPPPGGDSDHEHADLFVSVHETCGSSAVWVKPGIGRWLRPLASEHTLILTVPLQARSV